LYIILMDHRHKN